VKGKVKVVNRRFNSRQKILFLTLAAAGVIIFADYRPLTPKGEAQEIITGDSLAPTAQFCNSTPVSITGSLSMGKASPYPTTINVSDMTGLINSVSVKINNIQHAWGRDVDMLLVGPNGEKFIILSDVGQSGGFSTPVTITLSDSGAAILPNTDGLIAPGTYKPTNRSDEAPPDTFESPAPLGPYNNPATDGSATFSSVFNQVNPNGTWSLYVMDDSSSNSGSISGGWCVDIATSAPAPNNMQFAAADFNGNANSTGTATVNRANGGTGAVSVDYATSNGTATGGTSCSPGIDFVQTSGTLNFADGETSKNFAVQLCPDTSLEPNETINLTLFNPTGGAFIGIPGTATLTIIPAGPPAVQFCNTNPISIPIGMFPGHANPYPSTLNVSGMTGVVNSVKITINNLRHFWASDLDLLLMSPNGRNFVLMSDVGDQHGFDNFTTITLTDDAETDLLNVAIPIPSGAYKPTNLQDDDTYHAPAPGGPYNQPAPFGAATFASVFNNIDPNGTWALYIMDDGASAGGTIAGWCADIVTQAPLPDLVQFTSANYNRRAGTTAEVTVHRPNTSGGAISVNYATSNVTATGGASCDAANTDYISTSGALSFADGEASKTVSVQLCPGAAAEPEGETFNIALSNPTGGATLGTPSTAAVAIYNGDLPCTTTWTAAGSPHTIAGTRTIYADEVVCVEQGAAVQFGSSGKIHLYGEIRAFGTPAARVTFTGANVSPNRVEVAGKMDLRFTDIFVPLNINQGGSLTCGDCNFGLHGTVMTFSGLTVPPGAAARFVSLENTVFDSNDPIQSGNAQLYGGGMILLMKNVTFRNGAFFSVISSLYKLENVVSENSRYEGLSFAANGLQPTLLENLSVNNCTRAGLGLGGGNFFIGDNVTIRNCEYPVSGQLGLLPGSVLPLTGNRNNWIELGQPGGERVYAPVGLPYVVQGFTNIAEIEFLPGVTVKARPSFSFNTESGQLRVLGLPGAPVTFEPFDPAQKWDGGQFNFSGNRMDYVVLDGMDRGVVSAAGTGGDYYMDNSIVRNSNVGVKARLDSNGSGYLQTNLFTNNNTAILAEGTGILTRQRTNPNLFEGNSVAVNSSSVPDVRWNWWNSPTGPTTPANPGGTGDIINGSARFQPFRTTRPDTTDRPPVVRVSPGPFYRTALLEAGKKVLIHWDASDDHGIVKQKILFSPTLNARSAFTIIADDLAPDQRSFEFTVPSVGFIVSGAEQYVRVVAIDENGQEGFDDWQSLVPSGEINGDLTITSDVGGRTFNPGDQVQFTYRINTGFPIGSSINYYLIFDADRKILSNGANPVVTMPNVSTDSARLMITLSGGLNRQKYFFSEPFSIRYDKRFPDAAPQVALNSPAAGRQFAAGEVIPITWTASDDEAIRYFNIQTSSDGGRTWIEIAEKLPPGTTSYNWQPAARGAVPDVRVRVIAVDRRFQNSSDGANRIFSITAPASTPPSVQVTFPAEGTVYTVGQSSFIAANASDPDGRIQRVEFYAKGSAYLPEGDPHFIGSDTTAPYQVAWNYPDAEGFTITARAYDNHNQPVNSAPVNVTINPFNPAPLPIPRPELTNPVDGTVFAAPANITLEALPGVTNRTYVRVDFYNGTTLVGTDTTSPYSFTLNNLPAGKYTFFVKATANNNAESVSQLADVTVGTGNASRRTPFDFDGDGKADVAVFRPSDSIWYLQNSTTGFTGERFGLPADKIAPADFDGDGRTDIAVFRDGMWYWLQSSDHGFRAVQFGQTGDVPVPADYTGDGRAEAAVYRGGTWFTLNIVNEQFQGVQFGLASDRPVPADYDGDGKTDIAVYRDGTWFWLKSSDGSFRAMQFGLAQDKPTPGDYDGDGKADQAVYREGDWFVLGSTQGFYGGHFGIAADIPVAADYDGDGKTDWAVYREGVWYMLGSQAGFTAMQFGMAEDKPVPAAFVR
jgi:subtilisin-like proprotein convertase family protein